MPDEKLKIMVSSTVYGSERDLDQIGGILKGYGYEVVMSKNGTVYIQLGGANGGATDGAIEGVTKRTKKNLAVLLKAIIQNEGKRMPDYRAITNLYRTT